MGALSSHWLSSDASSLPGDDLLSLSSTSSRRSDEPEVVDDLSDFEGSSSESEYSDSTLFLYSVLRVPIPSSSAQEVLKEAHSAHLLAAWAASALVVAPLLRPELSTVCSKARGSMICRCL